MFCWMRVYLDFSDFFQTGVTINIGGTIVMKNRKAIREAAGPRRPLRKPPGKPLSPSSPAKPAGNRPAQPSPPPKKPAGK